ncbi:XRE family transcriptional regulator [Rhodococcus sp. 7Tela_A2]|uniref:XRE family transcriptional regulator n=1 Tax=Rhodococcus sp. 7Tela_A2 TaxID=3093744 RepID=UPI003BB731A7
MSIHALSTAEVAERAGVPIEALRSLLRRAQFPEADVVIGGTNARPVRGWTAETVDTWLESRSSPHQRGRT